jgi:prepilin-type N-terminal cleavage/methylation domain-containing protein/prepilin-type processing-associated H-X9-DG protein
MPLEIQVNLQKTRIEATMNNVVRRKLAFTLIELLVVIAIIAILAAILFPVYASAKMSAKKTVDLSNMKQISMALTMYADDTDDRLPPCREDLLNLNQVTWVDAIKPYSKSNILNRSPFDNSAAWDDPVNKRLTSYGINAYYDFGHPPYMGVGLGQTANPSQCVLAAPLEEIVRGRGVVIKGEHFMAMYYGTPARSTNAKFQALQWDTVAREPRMVAIRQAFGVANYAFADGHAKSVSFGVTWKQTDGFEPTVDWYDPLKN